MERIPRPGEIYQHFKGNLYRIVTLAEHSESQEQLVIYQALYGNLKVYARPLDMFMEKMDKEKYPLAEAEYRFTRLPLVEVTEQEFFAGTAARLSGDEVSDQTVENEVKPQMTEESIAAETAVLNDNSAGADEEFKLDPMLLAFLDADSYERKLEIFDSMHGRIDQSMLNTVAVSLDLELSDGELEEQYQTLRNCMLTLERYECNRLR